MAYFRRLLVDLVLNVVFFYDQNSYIKIHLEYKECLPLSPWIN